MIETLEELNQLNNALPVGETEAEKQKTEALAMSIDSLHLQYRAVRAVFAAESYLMNKKFDYANTLCIFAQQILEELEANKVQATLFDADEQPYVALTLNSDLQTDVDVLSSRIKAEALLEQTEKTSGVNENHYLSEDLTRPVVFNPHGKYAVTPIPVSMHCATCKPLFFDLYADCVEYPDMTKRAEEKKANSNGFSWFRRWISHIC